MRLFDLHCDTLMRCVNEDGNLQRNSFDIDLQRGTAHYERWIQVTAAYVPDGLSDTESWDIAVRMLDRLRAEAAASGGPVLIRTADELARAREERGMFVLPAVENGAAIGTDLRKIGQLAAYGVVYMTITWNGSNALGNGCGASDPRGLTPLGIQAVDELYRHGILPDVSHLNEAGFWDVARIANGRPFLATHSLSKAVCDHRRSLTDTQFCAVRDSGGLVGLNLCLDQLGGADLDRVAAHLDRYLSLGGERAVALGLDLDGTTLPSEWGGIAVADLLFERLSALGYNKSLLDNLFFENSYRFFEKSLTSA